MSFKTGSKVVLKANATEMELGFDIDQVEAGKVYKVAVKRDNMVLLETGDNIFDRIIVEAKALEWAA